MHTVCTRGDLNRCIRMDSCTPGLLRHGHPLEWPADLRHRALVTLDRRCRVLPIFRGRGDLLNLPVYLTGEISKEELREHLKTFTKYSYKAIQHGQTPAVAMP